MNSILVATDFSKRSDAAVARGASLAKALGAQLTITHIIDSDQPDRLASAAENEAKALFNELAESLSREFGVVHSFAVVRGEPHVAILDAAREADAGLIVVGSHRKNPLRNAFVGTTAERAIRASDVPVLVARSKAGARYERPLVAVDLNERDLHPLAALKTLGLFDEKRSAAVFAYGMNGEYHLLRQAGASDSEVQKYLDEEEALVRPHAEDILKLANFHPAKIILKPALFNAHDPVLEAAAESGADLIVVGTKRKQAFERFRLGSVSEAILRRAETDVLVIPPGA